MGLLPDAAAEAVVYLLDYLIDSRKQAAEEILAPAFESLAHDGMVRVGENLRHNIPCVVPAVTALIEQQAHKLGDSESRVGVVDMDSHLVADIIERAVFAQVAVDYILNGRGDEEILLAQAKALALGMVIRGIENLAYDLRHGVLLHGAQVIALVEGVHVYFRALCAPEAQDADSLAVLAGDHHIIGYGVDFLRVLYIDAVIAVLPVIDDFAFEADIDALLLARDEPNFAAGKPEIGHLGLPAVNKLLLEDTVFIENGVAHSKISIGCKRIEIARRETAETAVAETRVRLAVIELVELYAEIFECLLHNGNEIEVIERVLERASHEELHAHIVHALRAALFAALFKLMPTLSEHIAGYHRDSLVKLLVVGLLGSYAEKVRELCGDLLLGGLLCQ